MLAVMCRQGFGNIADLMQKVVGFLRTQGPEESRDVDLIAARVALDAISRTGFGYEMGCCEDLGAAPEATPYIAALDSSELVSMKACPGMVICVHCLVSWPADFFPPALKSTWVKGPSGTPVKWF